LRQKGRHLMRGVAGEKDATGAPLRRDQRLELVGHDADELELVGGRAFRPIEATPDILMLDGLRGGLAREDHERPATMVRAHLHGHAGLFRLAELAQPWQIWTRRALGAGVDHQPVLDEAKILVTNAERLAHKAVAAIGADQPPPLDPMARAVLVLGRDHDLIGILRERDHGVAPPDIDTRQHSRDAIELGLECRLIDRCHFGPAVGRVRRHLVGQQNTAFVGEFVNRQKEGRRLDLVGNRDFLKHAEHVVVDDADARQVVERGVAFEHRDTVTGAAKQHGREHAGRTETGDHDVI